MLKYETSLYQRYREMNLKDSSFHTKIHSIVAMPSTRFMDLMTMEPKTSKIKAMLAAHYDASDFTRGMDKSRISTYVMYNIAYLFARVVGC